MEAAEKTPLPPDFIQEIRGSRRTALFSLEKVVVI